MIIGQQTYYLSQYIYLSNFRTYKYDSLQKCMLVVPYTSIPNTGYIWKKQTFVH